MPRATPDYRAARAVLAAPYPLPVVFTRHTRSDPPSDPAAQEGSLDGVPPLLAGNNTIHGFPAYNTHWRDLPPAIPPIPYPPKGDEAACGHREKRRMSLAGHGRKKSGANGEYELMSGIEEEPSRELLNARQIGAWSLEVGRQTVAPRSELPASYAGNVLTNTHQAMLPLDFIGGHAFQSSGPNISSMPNPPRWAGSLGVGLQPSLAAKYGQFSTPAVPPQQHIWTRPPPCRRSRVAVVRPSADIDSDDTLASDTDASLTASPQLITPASNATPRRGSKHSRSPAKATPTKSKPLFLGQTGLSPFTYMPPVRHRKGGGESSADEAGFETEATVRGTITRIALSRHLRGKHKHVPVAPTSTPHRSSRQPRNRTGRSTMPTSSGRPVSQHAPPVAGSPSMSMSTSRLISSVRDPLMTPPNQIATDRQIRSLPVRKQATPTETLSPRFDQVPSSGHSGNCLDLGPDTKRAAPWTPPLQVLQGYPPPSSSPSTPPPQLPSWSLCSPHSPPQPSQPWQLASQLSDIAPMDVDNKPTSQLSITLPQLASPFRQPLPALCTGQSACHPQPAVSMTARSCLSDAPSGSSVSAARRPELPIAKLCHNFLLAKKMQAAKKRKLGRKHAAEVVEREKASLENALSWQTKAIRIDPPLQVPQGMAAAPSAVAAAAAGVSTTTAAFASASGAAPAQASSTPRPSFTPFRAIESLARVDEGRPPRKRRRAATSSSEDDSPSTSIPMPAMFGGPKSETGTPFRSSAVTRQRAWRAGKSRRDL